MNTTVSKSFGLALLLAVGILAVMVALGTFSAQKAGAQVLNDDDETLTIESATPAPGAAVGIELSFTADANVGTFGTMEIELEGYGIPTTIETRSVLIRADNTDPPTDAGLPVEVTVAGQVITLELNDGPADDGTQAITSGDNVIIVLRQRAGITAPALAGTYDIRVDDRTIEDAVTVSATLKTDPTKGGGGTEVTVSGKAHANGSGTLYSHALIESDSNGDPDRSTLKGVTVANGAFETTVDASDLDKRDAGWQERYNVPRFQWSRDRNRLHGHRYHHLGVRFGR